MKSRSIWLAAISALLLLTSVTATRAQRAPFEKPNVAQDDSIGKPAVIVTGAVMLPSRVELRRAARLNEVFALVGGATERTGKVIRVYRAVPAADLDMLLTSDEVKNSTGYEAYKIAELAGRDEKANPFVRNGDVVYVEEVGIAYIAGDVKFPQRIKLTDGLTLRQAIGIAGGPLPGSERDKIIVRRQGIGQKEETLFFSRSDILLQRKDITLRHNDVVCVLGRAIIGRSCPFAGLPSRRVIIAEALPFRTLY